MLAMLRREDVLQMKLKWGEKISKKVAGNHLHGAKLICYRNSDRRSIFYVVLKSPQHFFVDFVRVYHGLAHQPMLIL